MHRDAEGWADFHLLLEAAQHLRHRGNEVNDITRLLWAMCYIFLLKLFICYLASHCAFFHWRRSAQKSNCTIHLSNPGLMGKRSWKGCEGHGALGDPFLMNPTTGIQLEVTRAPGWLPQGLSFSLWHLNVDKSVFSKKGRNVRQGRGAVNNHSWVSISPCSHNQSCWSSPGLFPKLEQHHFLYSSSFVWVPPCAMGTLHKSLQMLLLIKSWNHQLS